jgi:hypothetical protein
MAKPKQMKITVLMMTRLMPSKIRILDQCHKEFLVEKTFQLNFIYHTYILIYIHTVFQRVKSFEMKTTTICLYVKISLAWSLCRAVYQGA